MVRSPRQLARALVAALATFSVALVVAAGPAVAAVPAAPRVFSAAIEGFAPDQAQFFCRSSVEPGVKAFEKVLTSTYAGTAIVSDLRPCGSEASSEHMDGRALDWGVDHRTKTGLADGTALLNWLFATDSYGNKDAMLRRLGIMYVIWNKQIWGTWSQSWQPYSCSGVTACHIDHIHISFGWAGAEMKTSYWTGTVSPVLPPPLPQLSAVGSAAAFTVNPRTSSTVASFLLVPNATYTVTATGTWKFAGAAVYTADAACHERSATSWSRSTELVVNGSASWTSSAGTATCDLAHHTYTQVLHTSGQAAGEVTASINDATRSNDSGTLKVTIRRTA